MVSFMSDGIIQRRVLFGGYDGERKECKISPNGKFIAFLMSCNGVFNIYISSVYNIDEFFSVTDNLKISISAPMYEWSKDSNHILFVNDLDGDENYHVYAVGIENSVIRDLTPFSGARASIAKLSARYPGEVIVGCNVRDRRYNDYYRVNIATGEFHVICYNSGYYSFIFDDNFVARLALDYGADACLKIYRPDKSAGWVEWLAFSPEDSLTTIPTNIFTLDGQNVVIYSCAGRDKRALCKLNLNSGEIVVIGESSQSDVVDFLTNPESGEPMAYVVNYLRTECIAIDRSIENDINILNNANIGDWSVVSISEDNSIWIVIGGESNKSRSAYIYTRNNCMVNKLYDFNLALMNQTLSLMHPLEIESRDGYLLVSYLTLPLGSDAKKPGSPGSPLPMVLLVHGGPWWRDVYGLNVVHQWLASRGYAVLSINFRSSIGFGKEFIRAGKEEWGRKIDNDLLDGIDWAIANGVADASRIAIMGGSFGGYAVLSSMTRNPYLYSCGVDICGTSDLEVWLDNIPGYWASIRSLVIDAIGNPDTSEGRSLLRERSPINYAHCLARPLLIIQGENDPRVPKQQSDLMASAVKNNGIPMGYIVFENEGHEIMRSENKILKYAFIENFLAKYLGGYAEPVTSSEVDQAAARIYEDSVGLVQQ